MHQKCLEYYSKPIFFFIFSCKSILLNGSYKEKRLSMKYNVSNICTRSYEISPKAYL